MKKVGVVSIKSKNHLIIFSSEFLSSEGISESTFIRFSIKGFDISFMKVPYEESTIGDVEFKKYAGSNNLRVNSKKLVSEICGKIHLSKGSVTLSIYKDGDKYHIFDSPELRIDLDESTFTDYLLKYSKFLEKNLK